MKGLLIQEFKTLFKSPAAISILLIPIVLMVGLGYLLPSAWIVPSAITIGIVGAVLLYFGGSLEEIKRTSFMKSISLTRLNKFTFLATKILFSVFISLFSVLWVLFFAWIFTEPIPFLATNFSNLIPYNEGADVMNLVTQIPFVIKWDKINWIAMLYAGIMTIVVSISIAFVFVAFSKSSLSFYLMSFGYLLAMILFGGVVMPSFLIDKETNGWFTSLYYFVPNFYTNNVMATSFGSSMGAMVHTLTGKIDILAKNIDAAVTWLSDRFIELGEFGKAQGLQAFNYIVNEIIDPIAQIIDPQIDLNPGDFPVIQTSFIAIWPVIREKVIELSGKTEEISIFISNIVQFLQIQVLPKLDDMFNTAQWWDYIVPWLESALFLAIATKFFKWS